MVKIKINSYSSMRGAMPSGDEVNRIADEAIKPTLRKRVGSFFSGVKNLIVPLRRSR